MHIGNFASRNIIHGKGITRLKSRAVFLQIATYSRCYNRISDITISIFSIGRSQINRRQCLCSVPTNRQCIITRQNRRIIDRRHDDIKTLFCSDLRAIGHAIGETVARVLIACMLIGYFAISNILLGKGGTLSKINGHVIACSKIPVIACVSCLFQRANGRLC